MPTRISISISVLRYDWIIEVIHSLGRFLCYFWLMCTIYVFCVNQKENFRSATYTHYSLLYTWWWYALCVATNALHFALSAVCCDRSITPIDWIFGIYEQRKHKLCATRCCVAFFADITQRTRLVARKYLKKKLLTLLRIMIKTNIFGCRQSWSDAYTMYNSSS